MSDVPFSKAIPSEKLARPEGSRTDVPGTLKYHARTATVGNLPIQRVRVENEEILVTRLPNGEPVAFAPRCPHQGTDLVEATIFEGKLRCPKHQYLYDPKTGENIFPICDARPEVLWKLKPGYLKIYKVEEHDGWVWIACSPNPPPPAYDPAAELPPRPGPEISHPAPAAGPSEGGTEAVDHSPETLEMDAGAKLELELPTAPLPGHVWLYDVQSPCIKIVHQIYDESKSSHRLQVAAVEPGEAVLRCTYSKPWGRDRRETRTYRIRVCAPAGSPPVIRVLRNGDSVTDLL